MTFDQIKTAIKDYVTLSSTEADTRVGKAVNRHYRRLTSQLGLNAARFVTRSVTMTEGQQYVIFTEIEKIDRILDTSESASIRQLTEVNLHEIRTTQPSTGAPTKWALRNTDADSVTVLTDTVPATGSSWDLQADGWTTLSDLSGSDEPVFPESFHDILVWSVIAEELLKKEKDKLARTYEQKAAGLLSELKFHLADSPTLTTRQASAHSGMGSGGAGSGGGTLGGTAFTQTALQTFDRGAGIAPFAVQQSDAAKVTNLDADKLDGYNESAFAKLADNETVAGTWTFSADVYTVAWTDYSATSTVTGWAATPTVGIFYKRLGRLVYVNFSISGTSNDTVVTFTLPYTSVNVSPTNVFGGALTNAADNGATLTVASKVRLSGNASTVSCFANMGTGGWTGSGTKTVQGSFWYEAAS